MFKWLAERQGRRRRIEALYAAVVSQARRPTLYRVFAVPDTLEGRFELLVLHLFMVMERLQAEGAEGASVAQELADAFVRDLDTTLRELGVADLKVPKKVRAMTAACYERLQAYKEAAADRDPEALDAMLGHYLHDAADPARGLPSQLSAYLRKCMGKLDARPLPSLLQGDLGLAGIEPAGAEAPCLDAPR